MKRNLLLVLFSVFCFGAAYAGAGEMNVYASKLRVENVNDATNEVTVSYFLNAPATGLEFQLLRADGSIYRAITISDASKYTKGAHELTVDLSTARGGEYKWALKVSGTTVKNYTKVTDESEPYQLFGPRGVAVDNSFESNYFGQVYVTNFGGTSTMNAKRTTQTGVYVFDAGLGQVNSTAYQGGLTWGTNSGIQWAIARPCVGPDGTVYITSGSAANSGVWMMDPEHPTTFTPVFGGTHTETGTTKNGGTIIHNSILHCYVEGSGENRKLYTYDLTDASIGGDILRYDIGTLASPWTAAPSETIYSDASNGNKIQNGDCSIAPDGNGGWWMSQYQAGSASTGVPCLIHITNGTIDYNSGTTFKTSYQGGMAVSVDGKTLAIGTTRSNIRIYDVTYNADNKPTLELRTTIVWGSGRNAKGLAFDIANNLYAVDNNNEMFAVFATHGSTEFTTPAPSSRTITITQLPQDPLAGTYRIGGATPDFTSLYDAAWELGAWGASADVTFLICSDLTEDANIGLSNNSAHTVTIRPDADANRTITFTQNTDNGGPSGAFIIGAPNGIPDMTSITTRNVVIDGLASAEATHKMTIQVAKTFGSQLGVIVFYGGITNTTLKNCKIINNLDASSYRAYCINIRSTASAYPDGLIIENNEITSTAAGYGCTIFFDGSSSTSNPPANTIIRNNQITAKRDLILMNYCKNITVEDNIFRVKGSNGVLGKGIGYYTNTGQSSGDIIIRRNQFLELLTNNYYDERGFIAIEAMSGGNWIIENNLFTGFNAATNTRRGELIGIKTGGTPSSISIRHNTMVMPAFTKTYTSPALLSAFPVSLIYIAGGTPVIKNNILISHETTCVNSLIRGNLNANCLNNVYYSAGGSGVIVDGATACANWSEFTTKYSTQAASSQNVDVTFSGSEPYMLSAESANEAKLEVPNIDGLTTDIEGNTRYTPTHAGCYDLAWTLTLDETATNNSDAIEAKDERVMNVLFNRRFSVDAGLYTLVLPFDLTDEQLQEAFGADYQLSVLHDAYMKTPELMYLKFDHVNNLIAGEPCLLQVSKDVNEDILFRDVTIDKTDRSIQFAGDHDIARMIGLYDQTDIPASAKDYYLGNNNYLFQYKSTTTTKGFRAYFHFPDFGAGAPPRARVVFHDDTTTDVEPVEATPATIEPQKVIRNGELIIIVNGVEYDVTGRVRVR